MNQKLTTKLNFSCILMTLKYFESKYTNPLLKIKQRMLYFHLLYLNKEYNYFYYTYTQLSKLNKLDTVISLHNTRYIYNKPEDEPGNSLVYFEYHKPIDSIHWYNWKVYVKYLDSPDKYYMTTCFLDEKVDCWILWWKVMVYKFHIVDIESNDSMLFINEKRGNIIKLEKH